MGLLGPKGTRMCITGFNCPCNATCGNQGGFHKIVFESERVGDFGPLHN